MRGLIGKPCRRTDALTNKGARGPLVIAPIKQTTLARPNHMGTAATRLAVALEREIRSASIDFAANSLMRRSRPAKHSSTAWRRGGGKNRESRTNAIPSRGVEVIGGKLKTSIGGKLEVVGGMEPSSSCENADTTASTEKPNQINESESSIAARKASGGKQKSPQEDHGKEGSGRRCDCASGIGARRRSRRR